MQHKPIDKRVEDALNSLDGIERASVQPWFFTRLNARLQKDESSMWSSIGTFLARPAVAMGAICLVLALNLSILLSSKDEGSTMAQSGQLEPQLGNDSESVIASNSSFEYENLVQP